MAITVVYFPFTTRKRKHQEIAQVSVVQIFFWGSEISHLKRPCHAIPWVCLKLGDQTKSKVIIMFPATTIDLPKGWKITFLQQLVIN